MEGPSIEQQFEKLCSRVTELHSEWQMFSFLFGDPSHAQIYNDVDPQFFVRVERLFLERFCMFICRLGDRPKMSGRENLVLQRLSDHANEGSLEGADKLAEKLKQYKEKTARFRDLRNRFYGHSDLQEELGPARTLFSRRSVEEVLQILRDFMNLFRKAIGENEVTYESVITISNGEGLIAALRQAVAANTRIVDPLTDLHRNPNK